MISKLKETLHTIIFEAETPLGKLFDVTLILAILSSVTVVMLDSVVSINNLLGPLFTRLEWGFTILFTIEYALRLFCLKKPVHYARSFFGIVDLMAILPSYISVLIPGSQVFSVVRILRVLRVFRVLKLMQYVDETTILAESLKASSRKILVFIFAVLAVVVVFGSIMYVVEPASSGFTSIPNSVYWAIVTLTTVGYGDITPVTALGKCLSSAIMILGYGIIAVPAGIVSVDFATHSVQKSLTQLCRNCHGSHHDQGADYCKWCGRKLYKLLP